MAEVVIEERMLECGICFEMLSEDCKMLPCQHTYCRTCLQSINEHDGCLRCPQCRVLVNEPINRLPKNYVILSLIEQVKKNPPKPRVEDEEVAKAITISFEEFMNEKATNLLLKHNEQLQTQLALETSKRDALLESAKQTSQEYQELLQLQVAIDQSEEEAMFRKKNQDLISQKEKLENELALLKSQLETNSARSQNTGMESLFSWFATHSSNLSDGQRKEAENVLRSLRRATATQSNESTLRQLQSVLDKMEAGSSRQRSNKNPTNPSADEDIVIDDVIKNLRELKTMLKEESNNVKLNEQGHPQNYLSFPTNYIPPLIPDPRMCGPMPRYYGMSGSRPTHFPYTGPPQPPYYWPQQPFPPRFPHPAENNPSASTRGKAQPRGRGGRGKGGPSKPVFDKLGLNKLTEFKVGHSDSSGSLILPDVRDYDKLEKKRDSKQNLEKGKGSGSTSSRHDRKERKPSIDSTDSRNTTKNNRSQYQGRKSHRGRGGKQHSHRSTSDSQDQGFESDSSVTSMVSCASTVSTCSTTRTNRDKSHEYRRRQRNPNYRNSQKPAEKNDSGDTNKTEGEMKRLIYPSKKDALERNLDLKKPFDVPVICLGKDANKPVSKTVECLDDVYKFEETYQECRVVRI